MIEHLIQTYGLWALFTVGMLESIGFPVPGETALVTAALYAGSTHQIDIVRVVLDDRFHETTQFGPWF